MLGFFEFRIFVKFRFSHFRKVSFFVSCVKQEILIVGNQDFLQNKQTNNVARGYAATGKNKMSNSKKQAPQIFPVFGSCNLKF